MLDLFGSVINCAHRGASGHAPENTLSAIRWAINLGADMAEIDVQATADGHLVLFHDENLDRTCGAQGRLADYTLTELRTLDAGRWFGSHHAGEKIPTLAEAMSVARGHLALNIELKTDGTSAGLVDSVARMIADQNFTDQCIVTSFNHALIDDLAASKPGFALGYIIGDEGLPEGVFRAKVDLLSLEKSQVSASVLEFAVASGKAVHAWTVNEIEEMNRLIALGVGGVITNYPDRFPDESPYPTG